jgi:acyl carrier protein
MKDEIRTFITTSLLQGKPVADDEDLLLSGLIDSLGVMRLVRHLETSFGITVPPEDVIIEHFATVNDIAAYVQARAE